MKRTKVTDEQLSELVKESFSIYEILRKLGIKEAGGSHSHYKRRILKLNLDISHFGGKAHFKGKVSSKRRKKEDTLILRESGTRTKHTQLKRAMIESGIEHKCSKCDCPPIWFGIPLTLDVDHINENWSDDRLDNLRFLCPNCHSQFSRNLMANSSKARAIP